MKKSILSYSFFDSELYLMGDSKSGNYLRHLSLKKRIIQGLILVLIFAACSSKKEHPFDISYYEKSEQEWLNTMVKLGYKGIDIRNHVLLIAHTTECAPCLQELTWWNTQGKKEVDADITLLVIERNKPVFNAFIEAKHIDIPVFQDSSAVLFEQELIPTTPVRFYFDHNGHISAIDYMGAEGNIQEFLKQIKSV